MKQSSVFEKTLAPSGLGYLLRNCKMKATRNFKQRQIINKMSLSTPPGLPTGSLETRSTFIFEREAEIGFSINRDIFISFGLGFAKRSVNETPKTQQKARLYF